MRRAEILEGVRMLKLRDVLSRWQAKQISQLEAAELMGVSERAFRRWTRRFEEEGEAGLVDRRLGSRRRAASRRRKPSGWPSCTGRAMAGSPPSIFTSGWSGCTASIGVTPGPRRFCTAKVFWHRRRTAARGAPPQAC